MMGDRLDGGRRTPLVLSRARTSRPRGRSASTKVPLPFSPLFYYLYLLSKTNFLYDIFVARIRNSNCEMELTSTFLVQLVFSISLQ